MDLLQFIDGAWTPGAGEPIIDRSPTEPDRILASGPAATSEQVDVAAKAAKRAWRSWAGAPAHDRAAILSAAAARLEERADSHGLELAQEEGKTLAEGVGEVRRAAQILRYFAAQADAPAGELYASPRRGERILVERVPVGVVGVVTPFNFPIAIPAWKIAPALAYGNTVVWKPAGDVPMLATRLVEALVDAGLPRGVLSLIVGPSAVGRAIVEHEDVKCVTFTGSTGVGRSLIASCGQRGKPIQTEMGGKNASVVFADADLPAAVEQVVFGAFRSTGQKCTATSRLVVEDRAMDDVLGLLGQRLERWTVGDPTDPATAMGPLVSEAGLRTVVEGVQTALDSGATVVLGGEPYADDVRGSGWFYPPTVLQLPSPQPAIWRDELFGPVLAVLPARSVDEAYDLANDGEYGLSAAVFTNDLRKVTAAQERLDVGVLHINSETAGADPHVPFGGAKSSGYGPKEQGQAAREFYTRHRTTYLKAL